MLWLNRVVAWARRVGFWRVMALVLALMVLWMALRGPTDPTAVNILRR